MYAAMDSAVSGADPLPASLERDLHAMPGLALQTLINPRQLVDSLTGVTLIRAETLVEPREP